MDLAGKRLAVTGASGLLGSYVARAGLDAGAKVRAVIRNPQKGAFLEEWGVEVSRANLLDADALDRAFADCDAVLHVAALYTLKPRPWEDFYGPNVEGTANVLAAMGAAGVRRLVHVSTWGVYRMRPFKAMDETTPRVDGGRRQGGGYRATKALAEERCWQASSAGDIDLTVIRPAGIYGARDQVILPILRRMLKMPVAPATSALISMAYAADIARAMIRALERPETIGRAYNTGGPESSLGDLLRALARHDPEARARTFPLPIPLAMRVDSRRAVRELDYRITPPEVAMREILMEEGVL